MAPDKTNFLVQVISVGIITFAVTQDTLGVLRVCLGESAPCEATPGDKWRDEEPREGGWPDAQWPFIHLLIHSPTHRHPPAHSKLGPPHLGKGSR